MKKKQLATECISLPNRKATHNSSINMPLSFDLMTLRFTVTQRDYYLRSREYEISRLRNKGERFGEVEFKGMLQKLFPNASHYFVWENALQVKFSKYDFGLLSKLNTGTLTLPFNFQLQNPFRKGQSKLSLVVSFGVNREIIEQSIVRGLVKDVEGLRSELSNSLKIAGIPKSNHNILSEFGVPVEVIKELGFEIVENIQKRGREIIMTLLGSFEELEDLRDCSIEYHYENAELSQNYLVPNATYHASSINSWIIEQLRNKHGSDFDLSLNSPSIGGYYSESETWSKGKSSRRHRKQIVQNSGFKSYAHYKRFNASNTEGFKVFIGEHKDVTRYHYCITYYPIIKCNDGVERNILQCELRPTEKVLVQYRNRSIRELYTDQSPLLLPSLPDHTIQCSSKSSDFSALGKTVLCLLGFNTTQITRLVKGLVITLGNGKIDKYFPIFQNYFDFALSEAKSKVKIKLKMEFISRYNSELFRNSYANKLRDDIHDTDLEETLIRWELAFEINSQAEHPKTVKFSMTALRKKYPTLGWRKRLSKLDRKYQRMIQKAKREFTQAPELVAQILFGTDIQKIRELASPKSESSSASQLF